MSLNLVFISSEFNLSVGSSSESKVYLFEDFRLDVQRRMLYLGEREVVLPPKAIETLIALIELRGEIVRKGDLMKIIWADTIVEESNLDQTFTFYAKPFSHLYRIDTNGRDLRQLTDGESAESSSTISPDSKWVYYVAKVRDRKRLKAFLRKISIDSFHRLI